MKKLNISTFLLLTIIFLSSCAGSYKPIQPTHLYYVNTTTDNGIMFSYKHNVLSEAGNRKYAGKEKQKDIKLVAVRFINTSDSTFVIGKDIYFYNPYGQIYPIPPNAIKETIKQNVPSYLPYALFTLLNLTVSSGRTVDVYPIGLVLGPVLTLGNMFVAGNSNARLSAELNQYNLIGKEIHKNDTLYGIIGVLGTGYDPITIKTIKKLE